MPPSSAVPPTRLLRRGDIGSEVAEVRRRLLGLGLVAGTEGDEEFDAALDAAVRQFQQQRGLVADGLVGPDTVRAIDEAHWRLGDRLLTHQVSHPLRGDDVAALQERLTSMGFAPGRVDGIYGRLTSDAVREFQRNMGLAADGTCGPATLAALGRLSRTVTGGRPTALREHEAIRRLGATLAGRIVVVDPAHGGPDRGCLSVLPDGEAEADVVFDIAARIEGRLTALGASAFLSRPRDLDRTVEEQERARFANEAGADLVVSVHAAALDSPHARGVSTYYFGADRAGAQSAVGERLASLIQDEIVARTDLPDLRTHPKTWELLRWTTMPAVQVEVGYLSNPVDAARLADPAFRDVVAEAVVTGIHRLVSDPDD